MKRIKIKFAMDYNLSPYLISSDDEEMLDWVSSNGSYFGDLAFDMSNSDYPSSPGLYFGVVNVARKEPPDNHNAYKYILDSYAKIQNNNRDILLTLACILKQNGGEIEIDKHQLKTISNKCRIEQEHNIKDNKVILKLIETMEVL